MKNEMVEFAVFLLVSLPLEALEMVAEELSFTLEEENIPNEQYNVVKKWIELVESEISCRENDQCPTQTN